MTTTTRVPDHAHGLNGYTNYGCRCGTCRKANSDREKQNRQKRSQQPFSEIPHGLSGYTNYRCRCQTCRTAKSERNRAEYRQRVDGAS